MIKRFLSLSVLLAMLWGCTQVNEDTSATEEKTASYKVEHYQQNANDDGYTLVETDSENKNGKTGENTSAQAKTYEGFTAKTVEQVKITADGKAVVKIYYDRNEITLTLDLDGREGQTEITGKYGATVNVTAPTKNGYEFAGWNPELPTTFPAESATYTATWAKEGDYVITYKLNGGTNASDNPASYNVETATIKLKNATKTGYTFGGWYTDEACTETNKVTEITKGSTGAVTLYAKWDANTDTAYKVEHYQQNIDNDEYVLAEADTENKTGTTDTDTVATAKDYAGFTAKTIEQMKIAANGSTVVKIYYDRNTITLTLNLNGGEGKTEITGKYGADVTTPVNPTKTGYTFAEWNPSLPATFPAENATYTAQWNANTYTITYNLNGGTNAESNPENYTIETETITLSDASKDGYIFAGWYDENGDKVTQIPSDTAKDINVTAKWVKNPPTGFCFVEGATITGAITASGYKISVIFEKGKTVTVPNLYVCDHEVTQAEYEEYCEYGGTEPSDTYGIGDNYPAYYVSWYDALVYCNKRSMDEGLTPCYTINGSTNPTDWGSIPDSDSHENWDSWWAVTCDFTKNGYRLPTEAEWEYAARGGNGLTGTQYKYAGSDTIGDVAWYTDNSGSKTHPVKGKEANGLGLYDMSGNVGEWFWDSSDSGNRYLRGGSWDDSEVICAVSSRYSGKAYMRYISFGFRVVRTAD